MKLQKENGKKFMKKIKDPIRSFKIKRLNDYRLKELLYHLEGGTCPTCWRGTHDSELDKPHYYGDTIIGYSQCTFCGRVVCNDCQGSRECCWGDDDE